MNTFLNKTASAVALVCLLATGPAFADRLEGERDWRQGPPTVEDMLARMSEALDLSDEQSVEMLVVLQKHAAEREELRSQSMALLGPEICAQRAAAEDDILAVLTEEQAEQYLQMKEERRARAAERKRGRGQGRPDCSEYETDG